MKICVERCKDDTDTHSVNSCMVSGDCYNMIYAYCTYKVYSGANFYDMNKFLFGQPKSPLLIVRWDDYLYVILCDLINVSINCARVRVLRLFMRVSVVRVAWDGCGA